MWIFLYPFGIWKKWRDDGEGCLCEFSSHPPFISLKKASIRQINEKEGEERKQNEEKMEKRWNESYPQVCVSALIGLCTFGSNDFQDFMTRKGYLEGFPGAG